MRVRLRHDAGPPKPIPATATKDARRPLLKHPPAVHAFHEGRSSFLFPFENTTNFKGKF